MPPTQSSAPPFSWQDLEPSLKAALSRLPPSELERLEAQILPAAQAASMDQLSTYRPYPKQRDFHAAGAQFRERLLMAGNQLGKTLCASREAAFHATGRYPEDWTGKRFTRANVGWIAGISAEQTRDNAQRLVLGRDGQWGSGAIPKDALIGDPVMARSIAGAVDYVRVRHVSGMASLIAFKTYEKGREKWQGETIDWAWFDEEPPLDVYIEGLTRTNTSMGPVFITFTPLMGESAVVKRFTREKNPDRHVTSMTLDEAEHYTPDQRAKIEASYPEHEREARARGIPVLGSGLVFPVARSVISVPAFECPPHWPAIGALDFGWDHPTAAVKLRHDRDSDVIYVTNTYRQSRQITTVHAAALKPWGIKMPWAWPHDGYQHDKTSGVQTAQSYRTEGLNMLSEHAQFDDGSNGVEAGIEQMLKLMQTGRFKVFSHLNDWFEEHAAYHRKDGVIVKEEDDLMAATRYAYMMRRYARVIEEVPKSRYDMGRYSRKKLRGSAMSA